MSNASNGDMSLPSSDSTSTSSSSFYIDISPTTNNRKQTVERAAEQPCVDYSTSPLYEALKPLMISMKLWGMHYVRWTTPPRVVNPLMIYSWLLTLAIWFYLGSDIYIMCTMTHLNGWPLVSNTAGLAWISYTSLNALCFVRASHSSRALRRFFEAFVELDRFGGALTNIPKLSKIMMVLVIIFWLGLAGNVSLNFYTVFSTNLIDTSGSTLSTAMISETVSLKPSLIGIYSYSLFSLFGQTIWFFMALLELTMSALIYNEFSLYGTLLRKKYRVPSARTVSNADLENSNEPMTSFAMERERFLEMTRIVEAADNVFCLRNAASFACDVVILCVLIYTMLYYSLHDGHAWLNAFACWVGFAVADLTVICASGTLVLHGIEKVKESLLSINCEDIHEHNFNVQVMLFLGKLNDRIGLSAGKFFIIDQTAVLSLVGMFVTYFLIIVQFAPLSSAGEAASNETSTSAYPARLT